MGVTFAEESAPQDKFVNANGLRFHYLDWGNPSDPTILLLHGIAQTCHSWDFIALALSDRFHVMALDQRGHGDSDWAPDGVYSSEAYVQDIHGIVEALALDDFVLIGLSLGGRNALTYAALHHDGVRALAIVDVAPQVMRAGAENIRRFMQQEDELDSVDEFVARVQRYSPRRPVEQIRGSIMHNLKQLPTGKWTWKYDRLLRTPGRPTRSAPEMPEQLWGYVESLQCPTLVVRGGESDLIAMETAEAMSHRIPNGRLATVPKAGHLVTGDNPAGFQQAITVFLEELDRAS